MFNLFKKKRSSSIMNWKFVKGQLVVGEDNSNTYINEGYKSLPNLYGIISLIIQKSSIVPPEVFKIKNRSAAAKYKAAMKGVKTPADYAKALKFKSEGFEKVEGSELEMLLLKPNNFQTYEEFNEAVDGYLALTGNSYIWGAAPIVGQNKGKPNELHCLISPTVDIQTGTGLYTNPVSGYCVGGLEEKIPANEVAHLKYFNPLTSYQYSSESLYGMSPLLSCRRLLAKYRDADIAQGSSFVNMGIAGIISGETNGTITEQQARDIQDSFDTFNTGVANANKIKATAANVKWTQLALSPVDLNIIDAKEEVLNELCNVYHVPQGMFTKANSTENNMIESRKMFVTDAVIPMVERRKGKLNQWLAPKFGNDYYIDYDYTVFPEMNEDLNKLVEAAEKMYWITPNEKRELTGFDRHKNTKLDQIYLPMGIENIDAGEIEDINEDLLNE